MIGHIQAPLDINHQDEKTKQALLNDPTVLEGQWNFKGYYPFGCKIRPECHTKQMTFTHANKDSNS